MAYTKTKWVDHKVPAINALHLNHIEKGIYDATNLSLLNKQGLIDVNKTIAANKATAAACCSTNASSIASNTTSIGNNTSNQSLLTKGFHPQGNFTPQSSLEYPTNVTDQGYSYTIYLPNNTLSYTFTAGDLNGKTIHAGDHLYYTTASPHWHILKHNYVHKATATDVATGTNNDRYITPKELKNWSSTLKIDAYTKHESDSLYLPLTGGTLAGQLQVKKGTHIGHIATSSSGVFSMNSGGGWIGIGSDGSVVLSPKSGKKVTYNGVEIATVSNVKYLPLSGGTLTGSLTIKKGTHEGTFSLSASGVVSINTAGGWLGVNPDGSIALTPKLGEKVAVRGKEVLTGTYNATSKTLTLDV